MPQIRQFSTADTTGCLPNDLLASNTYLIGRTGVEREVAIYAKVKTFGFPGRYDRN